jgi:hypothetical protein
MSKIVQFSPGFLRINWNNAIASLLWKCYDIPVSQKKKKKVTILKGCVIAYLFYYLPLWHCINIVLGIEHQEMKQVAYKHRSHYT